jgi:tetratricopeptide (TPR) repeat protein
VIVGAGLCVYWNSLDAPFLWDDQLAVLSNQTIRALWPPWAPLLPPIETAVAGRPLVNLSLALNYWLGGLDVRGYHALNLTIHLSAALLLFAVVRRTLEGASLRQPLGEDAAHVAFLAAGWWSIHPLLTEVITYTTQRTTALMGLCFLLTLYCAIRALDSPRRARWRWHASAVMACACGMASKEEMVVAPIVLVLYDRIFVFSCGRDAWATRKHLYCGLASTWAGLAGFMWWWPRSTVRLDPADSWTYLLSQAQVIPHYLRLALWPDALVLDYGVLQPVPVGDAIAGGILVAALLTATIVALWRWPKLGFLGAVFFLTLAPTSSLVPITSEVGAERRMYLPLAAVAVLLVLSGQQLVARARSAWPSHRRVVAAAAIALSAGWVVSLAARTISRNAEYDNPVALWRSSVDHWPQGRARLSFAIELVKAGQSDAALRQLRAAVRDYPQAQFALGVELAAAGDETGAIHALDAFIAAAPEGADRIPARLLMGRLLFAAGKVEESAQHFRKVVALAPTNLDAQLSLGDVMWTQGRYADAASHYRTAVGMQPNRADSQIRLGNALAQMGQLQAAEEHFRAAVALEERNEVARSQLNRAVALRQTR